MTKTQKRRKQQIMARIANKRFDDIDRECIEQGTAIDRRFEIGVVHTPRIRFTYRCDGFVFNTGSKHRYGGGLRHNANDGLRPIAKPIRHKNSKQRNIRLETAIKQTEHPQLLKQLDIRHVQHLMEYKARLVRPKDKVE